MSKTNTKSGATSSAANAAKRALAFLDAAEQAEAHDAARCRQFIEQQRAALAPQVDDWRKGPTSNKPATEPRTVDGCTLAQLDERTTWEGTRPQIVAPVIESAREIVRQAAKITRNAADFGHAIAAQRAAFPGEQLGKLRSLEGRTAFDAAFRAPQ